MANPREHLAKALENEELLREVPFSRGDYPAWAITINFYAAVHWLRAFLSANGIGAGRDDDLQYNAFSTHLTALGRKLSIDVDDVLNEFDDLRDLATMSRYRCKSQGWYSQHLLEAELALKSVRQFVTQNGVNP